MSEKDFYEENGYINQDIFIKPSNKPKQSFNIRKAGECFQKGIFIALFIGQILLIPIFIISILPSISDYLSKNSENVMQFYRNMLLTIADTVIIVFGLLLIDMLVITFVFILPMIDKKKD